MDVEKYREGFKEYLRCSNQTQVTVQVLSENAAYLGLNTAKTILSIGPGFGDVEKLIIERCMPEVQTIILVDTDEKFLDATSKSIQSVNIGRTFGVYTKCTSIEEISEFPNSKFDFILCSHSLYQVKNLSKEVRKLRSWLTPCTGRMAVIFSNSHGNFVKSVMSLKKAEYGHGPCIYAEAMEEVIKEVKIPCLVFRRETGINIDVADKQVLPQFGLCRSLEFKEANEIFRFLESRAVPSSSGSKIWRQTEVIFALGPETHSYADLA